MSTATITKSVPSTAIGSGIAIQADLEENNLRFFGDLRRNSSFVFSSELERYRRYGGTLTVYHKTGKDKYCRLSDAFLNPKNRVETIHYDVGTSVIVCHLKSKVVR